MSYAITAIVFLVVGFWIGSKIMKYACILAVDKEIDKIKEKYHLVPRTTKKG